MGDISSAVFQMGILLIVTAVGYLAAKLGYLDMRAKDKITALLLNITLPCMIIASAGNLNASTLGIQVPLSLALGALAFFLWVFVAFLFNVVFRVPKEQRPLYYFMSVCSNTSFIGIPVADALYGESAALLCSVFIMATSTLMYSVGIALLVGGGSGNKKDVLRAVISPLTIAALLAIALVFSEAHLPLLLQDSLELIGSITPPVAMMLVGVIIANEKISRVVKEWRLYRTVTWQSGGSCVSRLLWRRCIHRCEKSKSRASPPFGGSSQTACRMCSASPATMWRQYSIT